MKSGVADAQLSSMDSQEWQAPKPALLVIVPVAAGLVTKPGVGVAEPPLPSNAFSRQVTLSVSETAAQQAGMLGERLPQAAHT